MFGSENSPMKIPPKKEDVSFVQRGDGVEENKPKKPPANVRKEFKDVLEENETLSELEFDKASKKLTGNKPAKVFKTGEESSMSLFDLSGQTLKDSLHRIKKDLPQGYVSDEVPEDIGSLEDKGSIKEFSEEIVSFDKRPAKTNKFDTFAQPLADLTYVNPLGNQVQPIEITGHVKVERPEMISSPSPIQDIVAKLIDQLTIVEMKGQTDTILTLNAGTFKGAVVIISQFDSANGQLNIAFENLTQRGQQILDAQPNREALMLALSEKGYTVQQLTTTTVLEHKPIDISQSETRFGRPGEERQNQENKEQK